MSYKAIYTYAWDLAETGVEAAASEFRGLGLDTVTIAGSYHAGKFMRPHGKTGKVYFPDDGTVYFKADPSRYGTIKPVANGLVGERDVLRELTEKSGMEVNVWLVLLHNTRLGMAHPDAVVRNAWRQAMMAGLKPTLACVRAFSETDFRPDLANFTMPTLVIHGSDDRTVPIDLTARAAAKAIPNARLVEYEGSAHGLFASDARRLTGDLVEFFAAG